MGEVHQRARLFRCWQVGNACDASQTVNDIGVRVKSVATINGYVHSTTRKMMDEYDIFDSEDTLRDFAAERHKIISANCVAFFRQVEGHVNLLERCGVVPDAETEPVAECYAGMTDWLSDMQERLNRLKRKG